MFSRDPREVLSRFGPTALAIYVVIELEHSEGSAVTYSSLNRITGISTRQIHNMTRQLLEAGYVKASVGGGRGIETRLQPTHAPAPSDLTIWRKWQEANL